MQRDKKDVNVLLMNKVFDPIFYDIKFKMAQVEDEKLLYFILVCCAAFF